MWWESQLPTSPLKPIRLLLVDDHALIRDSLGAQLDGRQGIRVVGTASDAEQALHLAMELEADMVLMDIDMPGLICFDAAKRLAALCPQTQVIFPERLLSRSLH